MTWYLYVVECADSSLYTGIAIDPERRVREHNTSARGSRYTRGRRPVRLRAAWEIGDRSAASSAEAAYKRLTRTRKEELLGGDRGDLMRALGIDD